MSIGCPGFRLSMLAALAGDSKSDRAARADIYKEIKILAQVQHPNVLYLRVRSVVPLPNGSSLWHLAPDAWPHHQEYFEEAGKVFIVTELIKGGELLHAVSEMGNYGEADARAVFKQARSPVRAAAAALARERCCLRH